MDFFDVVNSRRSVRKFKSEAVSRDDIIKILSCADKAPSAMNMKPWEFVVVAGQTAVELGTSYGSVTKERILKSPEQFAVLPGMRAELLKFSENYGGAPVIIAVLCRATDDAAYRKAYLESASAAMENLVLSAAALGLGTCWMTGPLRDEPSLRRLLQVPADRDIVALTPLGYPDSTPGPRKGTDISEKIRWIGF